MGILSLSAALGRVEMSEAVPGGEGGKQGEAVNLHVLYEQLVPQVSLASLLLLSHWGRLP